MGIFSFFNHFRKRSHFRSVSAVLPGLLTRTQIQRLAAELVDRRQILELAAEISGKGEETFGQLVAAKLQIPWAKQYPLMDIDHLNERWSFDDLRRCGAMAVSTQGMFRGFICSDPALLKLLPGRLGTIAIALGSWTRIKASLDESEKRHLQEMEGKQEARRIKLTVAATQALNQLISEVLKTEQT